MSLHYLLGGDSFTFLYVDDVRTSQEERLWTSRPVTGIALVLLNYVGRSRDEGLS
jgi:hypothetical protein